VFPIVLAGQEATALQFRQLQPLSGMVTGDISNGTATFADISELSLPLDAGARYTYRICLMAVGTTTADLKTDMIVPPGASGLKACWGMAPAGTDRQDTNVRLGVHQFNTAVVYGMHSTTLGAGVFEEGTITTVSAGNMTPRFAQNTGDGANPTKIFAGSYVMAWRIA